MKKTNMKMEHFIISDFHGPKNKPVIILSIILFILHPAVSSHADFIGNYACFNI